MRARRSVRTIALVLVCLWVCPARAQPRATESQHQVWYGYMTQTRFADRLSLWNDAHVVPGAFYILRTGLTYHLAERLTATAGYAFLGLPLGSVTPDLKRREHRPWGQLVYNPRFGSTWGMIHRYRHDARFRRNVVGGQLAPGYGFSNRSRYFVSLRRDLPELRLGDRTVAYVTVGNEVLVEWGGVQGVRLDQNRLIAGLGLARKILSIQLSYMNRYVQLAPGGATKAVMNHTVVLWVFHNFDLRREPDPSPGIE